MDQSSLWDYTYNLSPDDGDCSDGHGIAIFGYIAKYFVSLMELTNNSKEL